MRIVNVRYVTVSKRETAEVGDLLLHRRLINPNLPTRLIASRYRRAASPSVPIRPTGHPVDGACVYLVSLEFPLGRRPKTAAGPM